MLTLPEIDEVLVRYGRGELDVHAAVAALGVAVRVVRPAGCEESQPGGDAYRHYAVPTPPDAYRNPGAPVIPAVYRTT
jgi:hypothetical protein